MNSSDGDDPIRLVSRRIDFLELLDGVSLEKPVIGSRLDCSRSTVDRAIRELTDEGLVERTDDGYRTTLAGRLLAEQYRAYIDESTAVVDATDVLEPLPPDCEVNAPILTGGDADLAAPPAPYRPVERIRQSVQSADRYQSVLPVLSDPRHVRLCHEQVVTAGCVADLVVDRDLFENLRSEFPRRLAAMAETDRFDVYVGDVPAYGVVIVEDGDETRIHLVVFDDGGTVHGVVHNDTEAALDWARERFEAARDGAERVTDLVATPPAAGGDALPTALAAEGFVEVSADYFTDRSVAPPTEAWRAGLGLPEVQAGYPIDRTGPGEDDPSLTDWLHGRLRQGVDCAVLGAPGSGKSTACKQVACEWYRTGDPVFYREHGSGRPFGSVDALADTLDDVDGRPLVVVEDVVRPDASRSFEAMGEAPDDAVFLVDARRGEWTDPPEDAADRIDRDRVETVTMPALLGQDCERFVEQFTQTIGRDLDVAADRLRSEIHGSDADGPQPGAALLLTHRLVGYVDPMTESGSTTLESQTRALAAELATAGNDALAVGLAANLLNAVGVAVHPEFLYAIVAAERTRGDPGGCRSVAIEAALERLDGRVLFGRNDDGSYQTVHEAWSATFLAELLDAADDDSHPVPGDVTRQATRVVRALLALAADPSARERTREAVDRPTLLARIEDEPWAWVEDLVEQLYTAVSQRPKVAPLLPTTDEVDLPSGLDPACRVQMERRLANAYLNAGDGDAADAAVDRMEMAIDAVADSLSEERERAFRAAAIYRRGRAANCRGDLDAAESAYRRALETYEAVDDDHGMSNCLNSLGIMADREGDWADSIDYYRRSLERARAAGTTRLVAARLVNIGLAHLRRGDHDEAEPRLEEAAEIARDAGVATIEIQALNNLGVLARNRGNLETAERRFLETLEGRRELGLVRDEALTLWNLAEVARRRGAYADARSYAERARDTYETVGDELGVARSRVVLAHVDHDDGVPERAIEPAREALERLQGSDGDRLAEASASIVLGKALRADGRLDEAEGHLDRASDLCDDLGTPLGRAWCRRQHGLLAADRGEVETARERLEAARELAEEAGLDRTVADVCADLGRIAADEAAHDRARRLYEEAADTYCGCDAAPLALETFDSLLDACEALGEYAAAVEHCERAAEVAAEAGEEAARDRFRDRCREFERTVAE